MTKYNGIITSSYVPNSDFPKIEIALGLEPNTLADIEWHVDFYVYGSNTAQTWLQPAEYEEIGDKDTINVFYQLIDDTEVFADKDQIASVEQYRPDEDELFWDIVIADTKKFEKY